MTKLEAYIQALGDEAIHIEGIDWDSEADDEFYEELELIKQMLNELEKKNEHI